MNNPFSRIPGLSLAQGLQAGYQAAGAGLQNVDTVNKLSEWNKNAAIRELQRAAAQDQLTTNNQLNAASNKTLLGIQQLRPQLYSSQDGYLQALNQISPVGQGFTRRLSSDGKTIETVNPLGAVVGTTPNYTGKAAENALLNAGGISLAARAQQLPQQEEADAKNQTALMVEKMRADAQRDVAELGLKAARAAAGGGRGGKGLDPNGMPKYSAEDYKILQPMLMGQLNLLSAKPLPMHKDGTVNMEMLTDPAQIAQAAELNRQAGAVMLQGMAQGLPPALSAQSGIAQATQQSSARAQQAANMSRLQGAAQQADRDLQKAQPTTQNPFFNNTNPYSADTPLRINPDAVTDFGNTVRPYVPNVLQQQVPVQKPSEDFLNRYGNVYLD